MTDARRRIRDISHGNKRWIVTLVARRHADGVWRGRGAFFPDSAARSPGLEDTLTFEALDFEELAAQAVAGGPGEICGRLGRGRRGRGRWRAAFLRAVV